MVIKVEKDAAKMLKEAAEFIAEQEFKIRRMAHERDEVITDILRQKGFAPADVERIENAPDWSELIITLKRREDVG